MTDTWLCIATGPSLRTADIDAARAAGWNLATCNRGFQYAPDARIYLAHDGNFWRKYGSTAAETLPHDCEMWTGSNWARLNFGARRLQFEHRGDPMPPRIMPHNQSGGMLVQVVALRRPRRIVLTGYDCQHTDGRAHIHEDYPEGWANAGRLDEVMPRWPPVAEYLQRLGIEVINATRETALDCFPCTDLESLL